jgi:predicted Zn-dependent peptidase
MTAVSAVAGVVAAVLLLASQPAAAQPSGVAREAFPNGMRVIVREDASAGLVSVSLQVSAASSGVTNFMQKVMLRGAAKWTAGGLTEAAERLGATLDAGADADHGEIRATALARHWERLLQLVADVALAPTFPPEEIERERRLILAQLQTRADTPFPVAFDTLMHALYGEHPYAIPALGRREVVAGLTRADLLAHHQATYRPERMVLAISGRVERGPVLRAVRRLFATRASTPASSDPAVEPPAPSARRLVLDRHAHQAQLLVGYLAPSVGEADYPAVSVLGAVLGGGVAGRLFMELREQRGLAYSTGVLAPMRTGPGYLLAYVGTAGAKLGTAEPALLEMLERMRVDGPTDAEVERARAYLLGQLALDLRTNARHAWHLAFFELAGLGADFAERHASALRGVTTAQVRAAARRYLTAPTVVALRPR